VLKVLGTAVVAGAVVVPVLRVLVVVVGRLGVDALVVVVVGFPVPVLVVRVDDPVLVVEVPVVVAAPIEKVPVVAKTSLMFPMFTAWRV